MTMRHLIINLEAPLMAFGGETIDNLGVIRPFPAASMITGLFANALGWRRIERQRHQELQDRMVFAARIDREPAGGVRMTDFQTAQLAANDRGWTTRGAPEGRAGGANTYLAPHLRYRDYYADMRVTVALRLEPAADAPTLDDLANALQQPARPLFIGRKPCLPSEPLYGDFAQGDTALAALLSVAPADNGRGALCRLQWPRGEGVADVDASRTRLITDQRNWSSSALHGGGRWVCEGSVDRSRWTEVAAS
ncbi:MAG: type I-E CRISPR-associated protein Cas5/CasD [Chloroflexota bacterium]|nr:type I-E CRISPR-associated protein Cas5/CasD [Chloroflexota bacterium]MDE2959656.1 type I-E CRISPR-associated protein Cas5/CasD [Chloroflexota bacterium]